MKIVVVYNLKSEAEAEAKAARLRTSGYSVQIEEAGVDLGTLRVMSTGHRDGATAVKDGTKSFRVAGTKP